MEHLIIILVASFAFVALFGAFRLMSSAIKMTEKASEPEPSIMTELDRARSEIAFLRKDREAILREHRRLQVRIEELSK